jgi:hypothetical protein
MVKGARIFPDFVASLQDKNGEDSEIKASIAAPFELICDVRAIRYSNAKTI